MPLMALPLRPLMYQDIFKSSNFFSPDAASIHMYLVNPACESALQSGNVWICYEFGIVWMLNPDIFLSGDVTRSSPGLYHEYCIQDGNLIPRFSQGRARCKFCVLYNACSVANIPRGVLGTGVNPDMCRIGVDRQIRFCEVLRGLAPTSVAWVRILAKMPYVGWVCRWFFPLFRGVFSRYSSFPS